MKIHLAYHQIDSVLELATLHQPQKEYLQTPKGESVKNQRFIVFTHEKRDELLLDQQDILSKLVETDEDVDLEVAGKLISSTKRIVVDQKYEPVYSYILYDVLKKPNGETQERHHKKTLSNLNRPLPVIISDNLYSPEELIQNYVFRLHYYITHSDGVTFKFLYDVAKRLSEEGKLAEIETFNPETKKHEPLVLVDGGRKFPRTFVEGIVEGNSYALLLHLSDQELLMPREQENEFGEADE
jgi:hypothetical protein